MYRYSVYIASWLVISLTGSRAATAPWLTKIETPNFNHALASLLTTKAKPSPSDFDELFKQVIESDDYHALIASEAHPDSLPVLLEEVRVGNQVTDPTLSLSAASRALDPAGLPPGASTGLALNDIDLTETHAVVPVPAMRRPMARMVASAGDSAPAGVPAPATLSVSTDPASAQYQSTQYIITTLDTLVRVVAILNSVQSEIDAGNYLGAVARVDAECNFVLSKLADESIDKIFTRSDTAAKWKDALKQVGIQVATYVRTKPGADSWPAFKEQVVAAIGTLVDYGVVAKSAMESSAPPPAGTTNEQLQQQLQEEAINAGCLCLWKCLFSRCGGRSATTTTASPGSAASGTSAGPLVPASAAANTLRLALFIDSTVATIEGLIHEIRTLESAGPEGEQRLKNLQLRIGLRIMNMLKQAIANDAFEKIYDSLKTRSVYLMGSLNGVSSASAWDTIKGGVSDTLTAIVSDLNASKPGDVFVQPSGWMLM
jgi:hypothetical protein